MTTAAIEYIWKAIQESERSDELQFMNVEARWMPPAPLDVTEREPMTAVVADPSSMNSDPLPTVTWPPYSAAIAVIRRTLSRAAID